MLPRRKQKYRETLKHSIMATLLGRETYYVFYSIKTGMTEQYAKMMLWDSMYDLLKEMYISKGLEMAFYQDMAKPLNDWLENIQFLKMYCPSKQREKFVFIHEQGIQAERMYIQIGDILFNNLTKFPDVQLEMADIMFDLIGEKGDPTIQPVTFSTPYMACHLFTLKEEG